MKLAFTECVLVGENAAWQFAVGLLDGRWVGFARDGRKSQQARRAFASEGLPVEPGYMHIFAEVSEKHELGVTDRAQAIALVSALAEDPEQCFGGIDRWCIPKELRGRPDDFRCQSCDRVGCDGQVP